MSDPDKVLAFLCGSPFCSSVADIINGTLIKRELIVKALMDLMIRGYVRAKSERPTLYYEAPEGRAYIQAWYPSVEIWDGRILS